MSVQIPVSTDSPIWKAWEAYKGTDDYVNTRRWALNDAHVDGSLWAAFERGFRTTNVEAVRALLALVEEWKKDQDRTGEWHGEDQAYEEGKLDGREECAAELEAALRR